MHKMLNKYFWDGTTNISHEFILQRILEYASFADILKLSFEDVKKYLPKLNLSSFRTSKKRIEFIKLLLQHLNSANDWKTAIFLMINK